MWKEKAVEELKRHGHKLTPQRLKLLEVLDRLGKKHPSLAEILDEIHKEFPTVSFSTLYSNVLMLKELGLLEVFSLDGETRVELNTRPHINVISGDRVEDLEDLELIALLEKKTGRKIKLVNVIVE